VSEGGAAQHDYLIKKKKKKSSANGGEKKGKTNKEGLSYLGRFIGRPHTEKGGGGLGDGGKGGGGKENA